MAIKDDYIKVRVSKEQKKLFKRVAELKGITLTELLVGGTEERALREINKIEGAESLEERVAGSRPCFRWMRRCWHGCWKT